MREIYMIRISFVKHFSSDKYMKIHETIYIFLNILSVLKYALCVFYKYNVNNLHCIEILYAMFLIKIINRQKESSLKM